MFCFTGKQPSQRKNNFPPRFNNYWDMNIPTEYYEEEFLEFENYLEFTLKKKAWNIEEPNANADFYLEQFAKYEKYRDKENKKLIRKIKLMKQKREVNKPEGSGKQIKREGRNKQRMMKQKRVVKKPEGSGNKIKGEGRNNHKIMKQKRVLKKKEGSGKQMKGEDRNKQKTSFEARPTRRSSLQKKAEFENKEVDVSLIE